MRGFEQQDVAVFGLARSGLSAARALRAGHARVVAWDDAEARRQTAENAGIPVCDPGVWNWQALSAIVVTPGIPLTHPAPHPIVQAARRHGTKVIGDIELFARSVSRASACGARIVGITGTNGKSTTTALIGHALADQGYRAEVGGNIGTPVLETEPLTKAGFYVVELSSYQIDLAESLQSDVAVLINVTPDHLDRHGGFEGYVAAKRRLFEMQSADGIAVIGVDDEPSRAIAEWLEAAGRRVVRVAVGQALETGVSVVRGTLLESGRIIGDLSGLRTLRGAHNWQNAGCAFAALRALGISAEGILDAFGRFPGLPHRMEEVGNVRGVTFVNDSKATNPEAAARALACYEDTFLILGGQAKQGGIDGLESALAHIRKAYLIGTAAKAFAERLEGRVPFAVSGTLDCAVRQAAQDAWSSGLAHPVVLLSPACASFDQFKDFEDRGECFRRAVEALQSDRTEAGR